MSEDAFQLMQIPSQCNFLFVCEKQVRCAKNMYKSVLALTSVLSSPDVKNFLMYVISLL